MYQGEKARQANRFRFLSELIRRHPNAPITNSTQRLSGSKACQCGKTISMNKDFCLACKDSGAVARTVKRFARAVGIPA
jgi:hypothetical protein